ncbi:MAG TPA: hypothetical protein VMV92_08590 [Streptosporangiaceae bacterium]|nr:hypothetical protein [Streptosporangiaceae bacterium]
MAQLTVDPQGKRLRAPGWELRARWVHLDQAGWWRALVTVKRDLNLLVSSEGAAPGTLWIETWQDEPEDSDGVAVIEADDEPSALSRVPLCGCGVRGCGNVGLQLAREISAGDLPALVTLLRQLP